MVVARFYERTSRRRNSPVVTAATSQSLPNPEESSDKATVPRPPRDDGPDVDAGANSVQVTRSVDGKERRVKIAVDDITTGKAEYFSLQPGDIVFVPESFF